MTAFPAPGLAVVTVGDGPIGPTGRVVWAETSVVDTSATASATLVLRRIGKL
jgi:hypothetical protein